MQVEDVPKDVLKQLALQFQETNDGVIFEQIMLRVDRLVQWTMRGERRIWKHLCPEDLQDIYQAACVGLCNGISNVRQTDTPNHVISKLVAYMKAEIRKEFPPNRNKFYTTEEKTTTEPVYRHLESKCLGEVFQSLIAQGIITQQEYNLLCLRYVHELPWRAIAASAKMNIDCVKKMVYAARDRMRHQLRIRDITGED